MSNRLSHSWVRVRRLDRCCRHPASAFTLVEMLVAMAVTLILIAALAQAFAIVGEAVSQGRASIELMGGLRGVANQLQEDLQGITVQARPWTDDGSGSGYVEVVEGPERTRLPSTDSDWNGDGTNDTDPTVTNTVLGDVDDILGFTTRNANSPFVGQYVDGSANTQSLQSSLAEVVWWIQYDDRYITDPDEANGTQDAGENFSVYRRVLLIRPDLNNASGYFKQWTVNDDAPAPAVQSNAPGYASLRRDLATFFSQNDVSVRLRSGLVGGNLVVTATANSLADLTARENRFAHWQVLSDRSPSVGGNPQYSRPTTTNAVAASAPYDALYLGQFISYAFDVNRRSITSLYRLASPRLLHPNPPTLPLAYSNANFGEDVMVSNALSFDVRVFDPFAPVRPGNTGESLVPSDPGYFAAYSSSNLPPTYSQLAFNNYNNAYFTSQPPTILGLGTFVDLGYGIRSPYPTQCADWSYFSDRPAAKSGLAHNTTTKAGIYEYCTWSTHYERSGNANDGFDNDNQNGVDDVGERQTCPPYPVPLRGIQVKIRALEPDSRQIRQVSVVTDFIPE